MKKIILLLFLPFLTFAQIIKPIVWGKEIRQLSSTEYELIMTGKLENGWHLYSKKLKEGGVGVPAKIVVTATEAFETVGETKELGDLIDEYNKDFDEQQKYYKNGVAYHQTIKFKTEGSQRLPIVIDLTYQLCNDEQCLAPETENFEFIIGGPNVPQNAKNRTTTTNSLKISSLDITKPIVNCGEAILPKTKSNTLNLLLLGFFGGLIALLTPCVFPMIPLTVSFFTKKTESKQKGIINSFLFGGFILIIFLLLSLPFHLLDSVDSDLFNQISTNVWLNLLFFMVFVIFAFSFFGYYEIMLPSWLANKSDNASDIGGVVGIFFMALTLAIVSFSCTGPILGSLLAGALSTTGGAMQLTYAMGGFGLAWALIFGGLAMFPNLLGNLPKSGGWLNTIKVVLGFLELALAFKFLSKADLVSKTFLFKREIFIAIWLIIFICLALYLLGFIKFPHDDKNSKKNNVKRLLALVSFIFVGYLASGLLPSKSTNLTLLSGILPPKNVSLYATKDVVIKDYNEALQLAKAKNKPILLDFTGYGCENCRRMEDIVWSDPDVNEILRKKVILTSLYVDDKENLPESEQKEILLTTGKVRKLKTIGDKWSVFEAENFNSNAQPFYVIITPDQRIINHPIAGYNDKETFLNFLKCAMKAELSTITNQ